MKSLTKKRCIVRIEGDRSCEIEDEVISESTVQINVNGEELAILLTCAYDEKELGVGFLRTEGFIDGPEDLLDIKSEGNSLYFRIPDDKFEKEKRVQKYITSGCGRGVTFALARKAVKRGGDDPVIEPMISSAGISELMRNFQKDSELFKRTGGIHSAALCSKGESLIFSEDIGRHNAVDRVIGTAILRGISLEDKIVLTSGRVSSEIARKVAFADIPVLISRSAPTDLALKLAGELRLTVVGFARGSRMNIYTCRERVSI